MSDKRSRFMGILRYDLAMKAFVASAGITAALVPSMAFAGQVSSEPEDVQPQIEQQQSSSQQTPSSQSAIAEDLSTSPAEAAYTNPMLDSSQDVNSGEQPDSDGSSEAQQGESIDSNESQDSNLGNEVHQGRDLSLEGTQSNAPVSHSASQGGTSADADTGASQAHETGTASGADAPTPGMSSTDGATGREFRDEGTSSDGQTVTDPTLEQIYAMRHEAVLSNDGTLYVVAHDQTGRLKGDQGSVVSVDGSTYTGEVFDADAWGRGDLTDIGEGYTDEGTKARERLNGLVRRVVIVDPWRPRDVEQLFSSFHSCTSIDLRNLNTSRCTSFAGLFSSCESLQHIIGLENLDTSHVTNFNYLFSADQNLTSETVAGISHWNTHNVTSMSYTFFNTAFTNFDAVSTWDTSNVTDVSYALCQVQGNPDISGISHWNTSKVQTIASIFENDRISNFMPISHWDMSHVTNADRAFANCANFNNTTALSHWNTSSFQTARSMFIYDGFTNLDGLSGWNTANLEDGQLMFGALHNLENTDGIAHWNVSNLHNMYGMFWDSGVKPYGLRVNLSGWVITGTPIETYMFSGSPISTTATGYERTSNLRIVELDLNPTWRFTLDCGLDAVPKNNVYTGYWTDTTNKPQSTSSELVAGFDGTFPPKTATTLSKPVSNTSSALAASLVSSPALSLFSDPFISLYREGDEGPDPDGDPIIILWQRYDYTLSLDPNGGDGTRTDDTEDVDDSGNAHFIIPDSPFTKDGYTFIGWNTEPDGSGTPYAPGDTFNNQDLLLYAQWEVIPDSVIPNDPSDPAEPADPQDPQGPASVSPAVYHSGTAAVHDQVPSSENPTVASAEQAKHNALAQTSDSVSDSLAAALAGVGALALTGMVFARRFGRRH